MWISPFWYEKLPMLYAGAGLASAALLGTPGLPSAALFLGAAMLIGWWRHDFRRE
ncbi:hypothetical protein G8A07_10810 [Roseateles sp. DAIF2]|uniref:hypothetical protein n=1 Tax=Roseateles sp. DAIF2 TaxID=2714952 RepID=UPI0018A3180C|nr:hypothetical protein [Roseateles sp. DAIF2]QPF73360.1 hypothetical protein G8A07_10810 [Roseateles sp. DAIF2]